MSNYRIKKEKNNLGFKIDPDSMEIDEDIFSGKGNLNSVHIKRDDNFMSDDYSDEVDEINEKDSWKVISAFFDQHGLVNQQTDSFNQFIEKNIQEIIDENKSIIIEPDKGYVLKNISNHISYELNFGQAHIAANPQFLEKDGISEHKIFPNEARVRNLDYLSELSVDITFKERIYDKGDYTIVKEHELPKQNIGKIPIMVRSRYCSLNGLNNQERIDVKECEFDQGGYFIIGGGEKVIVAQERMATNFVYVFDKNEQSGFAWQAEIRSNIEGLNRPPMQFSVKISKKNVQSKNDLGGFIVARIPYIKVDVPIAILFRALGILSDKDIMDYIVFDENDNSFKELLRPSLDYANDYKDKELCLEYIGNKATKGEEKSRNERIRRAEEILRKDMLPHVSIEKGNEIKKAYFIGYMIFRLGNCALGRAYGDDRDHYGKKRLDMSGVLLCGIFTILF